MNPLTVYKASAGSGKTFTLAVQYIKLLLMSQEEGEYSHILAVTFTNKATTEMKDRILSQLYGIAHGLKESEPYLRVLQESLQDEQSNPIPEQELRHRCGTVLSQILHDYSRFRVQTIDAFFQTVLRGLAHELGLTANLQVEISDTEVLSKAVDRIIDRLESEPVVLDWLLSLVRDQIENNERWDVTRKVKSFGRAIFNEDYLRRGDKLRKVLCDDEAVRLFLSELNRQESSANEQVRLFAERLEATLKRHGIDCSVFTYGNNLASLIQKLNSAPPSDISLSARIEGWASDPLTLLRKADQQRDNLLEAADEVSSLLSELVEELPKAQFIINSSRLARSHIKQLRLLGFIDQEVADINTETSRFNLSKAPILLNRMVAGSDSPFVFEKIGALLHHVMIDEFQDTSRLQWENFCILLLESFSRGGRNLLVGDVKQSIYRWRGGDWRILGNIERTVVPKPDVKYLEMNRRSQRQVIEFNNSFFQTAVKALDAVSQREIQILKIRNHQDQPVFFADAYADVHQDIPSERPQAGFVRVSVADSTVYTKRQDWEPLIIDDLILQIRTLHEQGLPYSAMTILVRNNDDCLPIIQAFSQFPDMPSVVSDEAFLLSSSSAVTLLIEALRVLDDATNPIPAYYVRQQLDTLPHGNKASEWFFEEQEKLRLTPLYELLELLYRRFNLQLMPEQDAYLFAFFDAVIDYLRNEASDLHSFLTYWDEKLARQSIPAGQVDGIRIITIHKSKGLEFHTVLMPFCTWRFERDRADDLLWCSPKEEPYNQFQLLPITPNSKMAPNSVFANDYAESHLLSRLDELNALYVGFTRACENLFIWSVGDDLEKDSRTVGDLVAVTMQEIGPEATSTENGSENNEDFYIYNFGTPSLKVAAHDKVENRMILQGQSVPVRMSSHDLPVTFRQSNRSREFISQQTDADDELFASTEQARQQQYIELGRLLHSVLQSIATIDDIPRVLNRLEHEGVISRSLPSGTYVSVRRSDLEQWLQQGLKQPSVASWFSNEWQLFNECSIIRLDDQGQPQVLRPDRVMVSSDKNRVVVVDFKFGHHRDEYVEQVAQYMSILQSMYPQAHVTGYLWFVYKGEIRPITN